MEPARTKPLVEGALLAALVALLGLLSFYIGIGWLQPIPVLLASVRNGTRNAVLVTVVGVGLMGLWIGPLPALAALAFIAALGLVPGWALRRAATAGGTIAAMTLALLVSGFIGAMAALLVWHTNLWMETWAAFTTFLKAHAAQVRQLAGMSPQEVASLLLQAAPVLAASVAALQAGGVYFLSAAVLGRLGHPLPRLSPFATWRGPRWLVWLYLCALAGLLLAGGDKVTGTLALNLSMALGLVYTVMGGAAAYGWLRSRGVRRDTAAVAVVGGVGLLDALGLGVAPTALGVLASFRVPARPPTSGSGDDEEESG